MDHVVVAVPVFERGQRLVGIHQVAVGVVFDQYRAVLGAQLHQPRLVGVGHDAAQRILQVGHDHHGPYGGLTLQPLFEGQQVDPRLSCCRDFMNTQVEAFENLQQPMESG
ncbi:hypothetical protein D3C73_888260 [compost metagenome]